MRTDLLVKTNEALSLWNGVPRIASSFKMGLSVLIAAQDFEPLEDGILGKDDGVVSMFHSLFKTDITWDHIETDIRANDDLKISHWSKGLIEGVEAEEFIRHLHCQDTKLSVNRPCSIFDCTATPFGLLSCGPKKLPKNLQASPSYHSSYVSDPL